MLQIFRAEEANKRRSDFSRLFYLFVEIVYVYILTVFLLILSHKLFALIKNTISLNINFNEMT